MPPQLLLRLINLLLAGLLAGCALGGWIVLYPMLGRKAAAEYTAVVQAFNHRYYVLLLIGSVITLVLTTAALANIRNAGNARYNLTFAAAVCYGLALIVTFSGNVLRRRQISQTFSPTSTHSQRWLSGSVPVIAIILNTLGFTSLSLAALISIGLR
jgi:hypothetical protein